MNEPSWMIELDRQLRRGKHVLLYGNIDDRYRKEKGYDYLDKYLDTYFFSRGYRGIIHFNIAERGKVHYHPNGNVPEIKGVDQESIPACIEQICNVLSQPKQDRSIEAKESSTPQEQVPNATIFEFADRLATVQQQGERERQILVNLRKTMNLTLVVKPEILRLNSELPDQELVGRRNAMIFVASSLQAVPSWFYHDHPALALVRIPRPDKEERGKFFVNYFDKFVDPQGLDDQERAKIIDSFITNTEGMAIADLMSIARTAKSEAKKAHSNQEIKDLIFYYRYGDAKDPWESFNREKIRNAYSEITQRVIGQDEAVRRIVNMLKLANVGISMSPPSKTGGKPKGVFFFVGPTGVGKTELAKALAQLIFGSEDRMRRFDMSEYSQSHAAEKLTGAPPGYVGYEEGGQLTNYVRENPFSILLFDEIEKADGKVMDKFLQILEDGRLTDGKGLTVYFSQCVIIFTSNIGSDTLTGIEQITDLAPTYNEVQEHYKKEVQNHFVQKLGRPEIFNRLGNNILVFDLLRPSYIRGIYAKFMRNLEASASAHRYKLVYEVSNGGTTENPAESALCQWIVDLMQDRTNLLYGGRRIRVQMEEKIEQPLAGWVFDNMPPEESVLQLGIQNEKLTVKQK